MAKVKQTTKDSVPKRVMPVRRTRTLPKEQPVAPVAASKTKSAPASKAKSGVASKKNSKARATKISAASKKKAVSAKEVPKVTKSKAIAKKPAVRKSKLSDEERAAKEKEKEAKRLIREEKKRIAAEKRAIKLEKLKMWEINENKDIPKLEHNMIICKGGDKSDSKSQFKLNQCCLFCNNRLVYFHASRGNVAEFKKALRNYEHLTTVHQGFALHQEKQLLDIIIDHPTASKDLLKAYFEFLVMEMKSNEEVNTARATLPSVSLSTQGTGQYNKYMFNFPTRKIQLSRGGKEGNNAFTHDNKMRKRNQISVQDLLNRGDLPLEVIQFLTNLKVNEHSTYLDNYALQNNWVKAARKGNFALVRYILKDVQDKLKSMYLTKLQAACVLQGDDAKNVRLLSRNALTKPINQSESGILPAHIACINPDIQVLKTFFRVYPNGLQTDAKGRDLAHYAAIAQTSDALEFLIQRNQMVNNPDNDQLTPLMLACKRGRTHNVGLILQEQEKQLNMLDSKDEDYNSYLSFHQYMNNVGPYKNTPLHYAAKKGHLGIVKLLVEAGAALDQKNFYNDTPLSEACQNGHLEIAEILIDQGANIHGTDKQRRSPFIRACQNGQLHIVALLLRKGVSPNFSDSSENTGLHYAAAYGWLDIVKFLVEHGKADANRANEWRASPAYIAMLKGHFGIVDYLLDHTSGSMIDDQGRTLIAQLCMTINEDSSKNLKSLLKKIDVKIKDANGFNALHHLAMNDIHSAAKQSLIQQNTVEQKPTYFMKRGKRYTRPVYQPYKWWTNTTHYYPEDQDAYQKLHDRLQKEQVKCAELLLEAGLSTQDETNEESGQLTALYCAITTKSIPLVHLLIKTDPKSIAGKLKNNHYNILHQLAQEWILHDTTSVLEQLIKIPQIQKKLKTMAQEKDNSGRIPLLCYFNSNNGSFHDVLQREQDYFKYMYSSYLSKYHQNFKKIVDIYVNQLGVDVACQVGIPPGQEKILQGYQEEGKIDQDTFDRIINLRYEPKNEDEDSKDSKERDFDKDEIETFDSEKEQMGLMYQPQQDSQNNHSHFGSSMFGSNRYSRYNRTRKAPRKAASALFGGARNSNSNQDDKWDLDQHIPSFYANDVKKTALHFLLDGLNLLNNQKNNAYWLNHSNNHSYGSFGGGGLFGSSPFASFGRQSQQSSQKAQASFNHQEKFNKFVEEFEDFILHLINMSKNSVQKNKKDDIQYKGFNKFDSNNQNPVFLAMSHNQLQLLQKMTETNLVALDISQKKTGLTILHYAAGKLRAQDQIDEFFKVAAKKINFKSIDKNGNSALHYASQCRNVDFVRTLLASNQFDVNDGNKYGLTPMHMSLFTFNESQDHTPALEKLFIANNVKINQADVDGRTPPFYLFFKHKQADHNQSSNDPVNVLMAILNACKVNLDHADRNGNLMLHYACMRGSTICALTLMNQGSPTTVFNLLGNTPFAEAMRHKQHQLCTFMIQNDTGTNEMINFPDRCYQNLQFRQAQDYLLDEKTNALTSKKTKFTDQKSYIESNFKLQPKSAFEISIENSWSGITYLLFSKKYDQFETLASCLRAIKLESFLDFLEGVPPNEVQRVDADGNNLIQILIQKAAPTTTSSSDMEKLKRYLKIIEQLRNKPYNIDLFHQNNKGENILHLVAKQENLWLFSELITIFKKEFSKLMQAKENNYNCNALVLFLISVNKIPSSDTFIKFMQKFNLKQTDLSYTWNLDDEGKKPPVAPYLVRFAPSLLNPNIHQAVKAHIMHEFVEDIQKPNCIEYFCQFMKMMEPYFNVQEAKTKETPLIHAVRMVRESYVLKYMLGWVMNNEKNDLVESYKSVKVDLNMQDSHGRTALHWAICPQLSNKNGQQGSWQNLNILQLLIKAGASPFIKDNLGKTCLDYAVKNPAVMQQLEQASKKSPSADSKSILQLKKQDPSDEFLKFTNQAYEADAEKYIRKKIAELEEKKMQIDTELVKPTVPIDPNAAVSKDACSVVMVPNDQHSMDKELFYDVALIKVDVKAQFYGLYVFYVIQLIYDKVKDMYILFTRWGRIGSTGQFQITPFPNLISADAEFKKVFRQKTGNNWQKIDEFANIPKKYKLRRVSGQTVFQTKDMVKWQASELDIDLSKLFLNFEDEKLAKSKMTEAQMEFIKPLVDNAAQSRSLQSFHGQSNSQDLFYECLLDKKLFNRLTEILIKLYHVSQAKHKSAVMTKEGRDLNSYTKNTEDEWDLINEFYEISTPQNFAFDRVPILNHPNQIIAQLKFITQLFDVEHVSKLILGASLNMDKVNPYDYCYNMLNCKISPLATQSDVWNKILFYINKSAESHYSHCIVKNIFQVDSTNQGLSSTTQAQQENERIFNDLHNHFMLWHGTSNANLLSIIEQGLQVSPQNCYRRTGQVFGPGIYFADSFQFAANYSESYDDSWYVLLCEVALGNVQNSLYGNQNNISMHESIDMTKGYHSTRIMGQEGPDLQHNWVSSEGQVWPLGENIDYPPAEIQLNNKTYSSVGDIPGPQTKLLNQKKECSFNTHWFAPNVIDYYGVDQQPQQSFGGGFFGGGFGSYNRGFNYTSTNAQYIVRNGSQVRVKYIVQIQKKQQE